MDIDTAEKIDGLLSKKVKLVERVFNLTDSFVKQMDTNDAQKYIYLIERRQNLFDDMIQLDQDLAAVGFSDDMKINAAIQEKANTIKTISGSIVQLDKSMTGVVDSMMNTIKLNMRNTTQNKAVTNRYVNDAYLGASKFDIRN